LEKLFSFFQGMPSSSKPANERFVRERKFRHQVRLLRKVWDEKSEDELVGKTPLEQLRILASGMRELNKLLQMRRYCHHQIDANEDLDKFVLGFPEIRIWPKKEHLSLMVPLTISFRFIKDKKLYHGSLMLGSKA
jgi:hypothetical protein